MCSPATTAATTPVTTSRATTPATSNHPSEYNDASCRLPKPEIARDFHVETFFNPVWGAGPHVFSLAHDGTVVRPETYATEPYPGYHTDRNRAQRARSANSTYSQRLIGQGENPWKNVVITEQDDAEWAAIRANGSIGSGVWQPAGGFHTCNATELALTQCAQEPELVYTWPPKHNAPAARHNEKAPELVYTWPPKPGAC